MTALGELLWTPSPERAAATALAAFRRAVGRDDLHDWSVASPHDFWRQLWEVVGVRGDPGGTVLEPAEHMIDARFFPDGHLDVVENLLARTGPDEAAVAVDERGRRRSVSWDDLRRDVGAMAALLAEAGVVSGDRVAAFLPNDLDAVVTMLGAAALGASFTSTSPDFGVRGAVDRFAQTAPAVLVATTGYGYGGRRFECADKASAIAAALPGLRRCLLVDDDGLAPHLAPFVGAQVPSARRPFDHPWCVLYSSGTTGPPKAIVHRTGGVLLQHRKEHVLHCDVRAGDRLLYFTSTGWMMWNWLVSGLASGATVVLYDGSPTHPDERALLRVAAAEGVTLLGVSARYLATMAKDDVRADDLGELGVLRTVCSTGSPLAPDSAAWVYRRLAGDVHLASISGGTDLCACFVAGDPTASVRAGEIQGPALGMAVDVFDETGASLRDRPGEFGELVCRQAFPSQPLGFWGDADRSRYRSAYFDRFPGVWAHGDFAAWTESGGLVIGGRSDATLNPSGVRIGTAELYRAVEAVETVTEALACGQDVDGDSRVVLLVRLAPGRALDDALEAELRERIRIDCSPRHVPWRILAVHDLPRTRSGKLAELAAADVLNGRVVRNVDALANPESLDEIARVAEGPR